MPRKPEKIDLTSPTAIAIKIAAAGLVAWKLKNAYDRRNDKDNAPEPAPYPMNAVIPEGVVYVNTSGSGPLTVGTIDNEQGYITVRAEGMLGEDGEPLIELDEAASDLDPVRLTVLLDRVQAIKSEWLAKVAAVLPDYLQKG